MTDFKITSVHSIFSGTESIKFLGRKTWEVLPREIKQFESLKEFKKALKQLKPTSCPCSNKTVETNIVSM